MKFSNPIISESYTSDEQIIKFANPTDTTCKEILFNPGGCVDCGDSESSSGGTSGPIYWGDIIGKPTCFPACLDPLDARYVPLTRTLTINGTSYDLSADRSWTISDTNIYDNGLTKTGLNVQLGGTLVQDTIIDTDTFGLIVNNKLGIGGYSTSADLFSNLNIKGTISINNIVRGANTNYNISNDNYYYTDTVSSTNKIVNLPSIAQTGPGKIFVIRNDVRSTTNLIITCPATHGFDFWNTGAPPPTNITTYTLPPGESVTVTAIGYSAPNGVYSVVSNAIVTSGFVPYVGATTNLTMGLFGITANTINSMIIRLTSAGTSANMFFGDTSTLVNLTTGTSNLAIGNQSQSAVLGGSRNISIGHGTLPTITATSNNTVIGHTSASISVGNYNTIIGSENATSGSALASNNTIIGARVSSPGAISGNIIIADGSGNIRFKDDGASTFLSRLSGIGTRLVTADAVGTLNTIPTSSFPSSLLTLNINGVIQDLSANRSWKTALADTGCLTFGGITIASATQINLGAVTGVVVNNETTPGTPTHTDINYAGASNITVPTIGTGIATYVLIDNSGPTFQNTFPTSAQRKTKIYVAKIGHPNLVSISTAGNEPDFITSPLAQFRDVFQAFNYINQGVMATPVAASLTFNTSTGTITGNGINFVVDKTNPNTYTVAPTTPCSYLPRTQTGLGGGAISVVDVGTYDVAGTPTAIPGGANVSTLRYIFYVPPLGFIVQYGQTTYTSLTNAIAAVGRESFVLYPNLTRNAILVGVIAATKSCTNLADSTQAQFFKADIFGQIIGASAGVSTGTLQTAYNNSLVPQITTTTALGAVTFKNGKATDLLTVQEWQNLGGITTAGIAGNGNMVLGASFINGTSFNVSKDITGATTSYGNLSNGTIQSGVTAGGYYFASILNTAASVFNVSDVIHFGSSQGTIGAGSTVTNQYGFMAAASLTGATNNYGFYSNIASGTNRWNFYANGTASNYLSGSLGIGTTTLALKANIEGTNGLPATSGTAQNGSLRLLNVSSNGVLDFGNSSGIAWLQSVNKTNLATNLALLLNPNGGNVSVGKTTAATYTFDVNGSIGALETSGFYLNAAGTMTARLYYSGGVLLDRLAGTSFFIQLAGTNQLALNTTGALRLPAYTTPGHLVNDASGNITSAASVATTMGGTGITSYIIGDTLYASATNVLSKLAGNITTTRMFNTSTGTGVAAQAPAYFDLFGATNTWGAVNTFSSIATFSTGLTVTTGSVNVGIAADADYSFRGIKGAAFLNDAWYVYESGSTLFQELTSSTATYVASYLTATAATGYVEYLINGNGGAYVDTLIFNTSYPTTGLEIANTNLIDYGRSVNILLGSSTSTQMSWYTGSRAASNLVARIDTAGVFNTRNVYPLTDNTYYLGKNSSTTPFAWKGVILRDSVTANYYRIEMVSGVITATLL